jgi:hypothetical protein
MRDFKHDWKQAALLLAGVIADPATALADFKVKLPDAEFGELEVETVGSYGRSGKSPHQQRTELRPRDRIRLHQFLEKRPRIRNGS